MANGGLIGVDNDPVSQDELVTTFTSTGVFTTQPETTGVSYLVVAGGGASSAGGGGAGGFRTVTDDSFSVSGNSLYPVIVGAGGAGPVGPSPVAAGSGVETNCYKGSDSVFSTITSAGGGQGGRISGRVPTHPTGLNLGIGYPGGSGGGGGNMDVSYVSPAGTDNEGSGNTPPVSPPQGNDGGAQQNRTAGATSGGGGAGAVGADGGGPAVTYPGDGGAGTASSLSGSSVTYAGGGGGGRNEPGGAHGTGGAGGGGDGDSTVNGTGTAGTANTGGGAGGGGMASGGIRGAGNSGGSGIVIIKEPAITATHSGIWNMDDLYTYVSEDKWV